MYGTVVHQKSQIKTFFSTFMIKGVEQQTVLYIQCTPPFLAFTYQFQL